MHAHTSDLPLQGLRIAVTRPDTAVDELTEQLRARGAQPVRVPLTRVCPPHDAAPLSRAVRDLDTYDWIVFTSANAVRFFADAVPDVTARSAPRARIAVVGTATATAVEQMLGWRVHVVPAQQTGAAVVNAMQAVGPIGGKRILWPRARDAHDAVARAAAAAGAVLHDPEAYGTETVAAGVAQLLRLLEERALDAVTFTAPSAVLAVARQRPQLRAVVVAALGPTTAASLRAHGLPVHVEPVQHSIPALVDGLVRYFMRGR